MFTGILKRIQGWVKIKGGTDGSFIGNKGDHLKVLSKEEGDVVDTDFSATNVSIGTDTILYQYNSGAGVFYDFTAEFDDNDITLTINIDGTDIVDDLNLKDFETILNSGLSDSWKMNSDKIFSYKPPSPIAFDSSITITASNSGKNMLSYIVDIRKD